MSHFQPDQEQTIVVNLAKNGGFENGLKDWKRYKDAAGVAPVDGTGGSPTLTLSASVSSPLKGTASGLIGHAASNQQGEGVAMSFTLTKAERSRTLSIKGIYEILSGTYNPGGVGPTDYSDITMWVYDVSAGFLIQPSKYKLEGAVPGQTYRIDTDFTPVSLTSTSYRLIFHCSNTGTTAFNIQLDDIKIGVSDYSEMAKSVVARYRLTATPAVTTGNIIPFDDPQYDPSGTLSGGRFRAPRPGVYFVHCKLVSMSGTPAVEVWVNGAQYERVISCLTTGAFYSGGTFVGPVKAGDLIDMRPNSGVTVLGSGIDGAHLMISEVGVAAGSGGSSDSIGFEARNSSGQSIPAATATVVTGWTKINDSNSMLDAATGIATIMTPGRFQINWSISSGSSTTSLFVSVLQISRQGAAFGEDCKGSPFQYSGSYHVSHGAVALNLLAGDRIRIYAYDAAGGPLTTYPDATIWTMFKAAHLPIPTSTSPPTYVEYAAGSYTFTTPQGAKWIEGELIGGGGGGGESGTADGSGGSDGSASNFGGTLVICGGGSRGGRGTTLGIGGSASIALPAYGSSAQGGSGQGGGANYVNGATVQAGGQGAPGPRGGGGSGAGQGGNGQTAPANSGGGGGGASAEGQVNNISGAGGGAGGNARFVIPNPSGNYSVVVGAGGGGRTAGTNGHNGGNGGDGKLGLWIHY